MKFLIVLTTDLDHLKCLLLQSVCYTQLDLIQYKVDLGYPKLIPAIPVRVSSASPQLVICFNYHLFHIEITSYEDKCSQRIHS